MYKARESPPESFTFASNPLVVAPLIPRIPRGLDRNDRRPPATTERGVHRWRGVFPPRRGGGHRGARRQDFHIYVPSSLVAQPSLEGLSGALWDGFGAAVHAATAATFWTAVGTWRGADR